MEGSIDLGEFFGGGDGVAKGYRDLSRKKQKNHGYRGGQRGTLFLKKKKAEKAQRPETKYFRDRATVRPKKLGRIKGPENFRGCCVGGGYAQELQISSTKQREKDHHAGHAPENMDSAIEGGNRNG